jgi:hypothetical protein
MAGQIPDSNKDELLDWVHWCLRVGHLCFRPSLSFTLSEARLDLQDVLHVLRCSREVTLGDFALGCWTIRGPNADGVRIAVVIARRSEKNRVKILNVWVE